MADRCFWTCLRIAVCALTCALVLPALVRAAPQKDVNILQGAALEAYDHAEPVVFAPLNKLEHAVPELKGLDPSADPGALPTLLDRVGENVQAFFANFMDTTSLETIEESRMGSNGSDEHTIGQKFRYLMVVLPHDTEAKLQEYRTDLQGREFDYVSAADGFLKTSGFASQPQYFAPEHQTQSVFRALGFQMIDGQRTEAVAFAQRPEAAAVLGYFRTPSLSVPILVQGIAWIGVANDEILRMRTDLLAPQAWAGLERFTTEVLFREVRFHKTPAGFWLPAQVEVTVRWNGLAYHNRHRYKDFQLFTVETEQQVASPEPPRLEP